MSTKVTQKPRTKNQLFLEDAADYLLANGYKKSNSLEIGTAEYYFSHDLVVEIRGDKMEVATYVAGDTDRNAEYKTLHSVTGIGCFDMAAWIFLFHITGVVPIRAFIKGLIKEGVFMNGEDVFKSVFAHFKVTGDHNAVPTCY